MKIKIFLLTFLLSIGALVGFAQDEDASSESKEPAVKRTKAEIKAAIAEKVKTLENGDVVIEPPERPNVNLREISDVPFTLIYLMCYVDENSDFPKFAKIVSTKAKKDAKGMRIIDDLMDATAAYFSTQNLNFAKMSFSANNVRQKIDNGLPVFCWFQASELFSTTIAMRSKERPTDGDMKEWAVSLRKSSIKDFKKSNMRDDGLVVGYNKATNEYLVLFGSGKVWLTESEMKKAAYQLFQLRL